MYVYLKLALYARQLTNILCFLLRKRIFGYFEGALFLSAALQRIIPDRRLEASLLLRALGRGIPSAVDLLKVQISARH